MTTPTEDMKRILEKWGFSAPIKGEPMAVALIKFHNFMSWADQCLDDAGVSPYQYDKGPKTINPLNHIDGNP